MFYKDLTILFQMFFVIFFVWAYSTQAADVPLQTDFSVTKPDDALFARNILGYDNHGGQELFGNNWQKYSTRSYDFHRYN